MNRSAEDGEWSSPHYGGEGTWVPPRRTKVCAGDTVGKSVSDPGRPGIVHREGMAGNSATLANERARNRQRKARPEAPDGRGGYKRKRNSDRSGARSRIGARYSGTGSEQKAPDRRRTSGDAGRIQTTDRRGKAPCCVAATTRDARVSTWRKCGQVRKAKDPAPPSRRPASRPETLGDHHPPSTETITQESGLREKPRSRLSERTEEGRKPDLLRLYTPRTGKPSTWGRAAGVLRPRRGGTRDAKRRNRPGDHPHCGGTLESRVLRKAHARFGEGRMEKCSRSNSPAAYSTWSRTLFCGSAVSAIAGSAG